MTDYWASLAEKHYAEHPDITEGKVSISQPKCCFRACDEDARWDAEMREGSADGQHDTSGLWGYLCDKHFVLTRPVIGTKLRIKTEAIDMNMG